MREDAPVFRTRTLMTRSAMLVAELEVVIERSRALYRRAHVTAYGAVPIRGGSDGALIVGALSDAPLCQTCIAKIAGLPSQQIEAVLATVATGLKLTLRSGQCSACLENKAVTYGLTTTAKPPRRPVDKAEALWHFLEQRRGDMFCTSCLSTALGSSGRLDRTVIGAEARGARRIYGVCASCHRPRLVCGLTAT